MTMSALDTAREFVDSVVWGDHRKVWELMGIEAPAAPVYPDGFPPEVIEAFTAATGRAVVGQIGTSDQVKVTAFGPVVNLASRLEGMTKVLSAEIVIDE